MFLSSTREVGTLKIKLSKQVILPNIWYDFQIYIIRKEIDYLCSIDLLLGTGDFERLLHETVYIVFNRSVNSSV